MSKSSPFKLNPDASEFRPSFTEDNILEQVYTPLVAPNTDSFEFPFMFMNMRWLDEYKINNIARGFPDEEPCDASEFPKDVAEYYWVHQGEKDEEEWHMLCRLKNGCYVYYTASCDYTGFDCQGHMKLFISKNCSRILYEAMSETSRKDCISEKLHGRRIKMFLNHSEWKRL